MRKYALMQRSQRMKTRLTDVLYFLNVDGLICHRFLFIYLFLIIKSIPFHSGAVTATINRKKSNNLNFYIYFKPAWWMINVNNKTQYTHTQFNADDFFPLLLQDRKAIGFAVAVAVERKDR